MSFEAVAVPGVTERRKTDPLAILLLYIPLLGVTLISKFAVSVGATEILIGVPAILGATLLGIMSGRLTPEPVRLMLYLGMVSVILAEQAFAAYTFQPSSLSLLVALHLPYAFRMNGIGDDPNVHFRRFLDLCFVICIAGIIQYIAQFAIGQRYAFPIEHFLPDKFVPHAYHSLNPLKYGSPILKSNGVVLLEPSYFSQLLAIAFGLEAAGPQRVFRLLVFCFGFLVSFSGTGLIMMAFILPTLMVAYRRYSLLVLLIVGGMFVASFGGSLGLNMILSRAGEFQDSGSSGYQRYVGPVLLFGQYLASDPKRWLFGLGSGMMMRMTPRPMFAAAETGWVKVILEFGMVGAVAYFGFLYASIFRAKQPAVLRVGLAVMTLMSGILDPPAHGMIISLLIWMTPQRPDKPFGKQPPAPKPAPERHSTPLVRWAR